MTKFRLFSVIFSSLSLLLFYVNKLKSQRKDRGAWNQLIESLLMGPRVWSCGDIRHHQGNCYVIKLERQFLSDQMGKSNLILLEDGKNLPLPNTRNLQEIIDKGEGRYLHLEQELIFSPSDNAPPDVVQQRQYLLLESLSTDISVVEQLLSLNNRRAEYKNPLLFVLEKIRFYLANKLSFSALASANNQSMTLHNLSLDLTQWHAGLWQLKQAHVKLEQQPTNHLSVKLTDISVQGIDDHAELEFNAELDEAFNLRIQQLKLQVNGDSWLSLNCQWQSDTLQGADITLSRLASLREQLIAGVGGSAGDYDQWMQGFVNHWVSGELGFPWAPDVACKRKLIEVLSSDSNVSGLQLQIIEVNKRLRLTIPQARSAEAVQ